MQNFFMFVDKSDPEDIKKVYFNLEDVTAIEESFIPVSPLQASNGEAQTQYVLAIYTRSNVLAKKSNCMVLTFPTRELRDKATATFHSKLNPTVIEAQWFAL